MDEPTLGLDPEAARQFLQLIVELGHEGITLMLSSHLLHQVQSVCNRVGLFARGKLQLVGAVPELAQQVLGGGYRIHVQATSVTRAVGDVDAANRVGGATPRAPPTPLLPIPMARPRMAAVTGRR